MSYRTFSREFFYSILEETIYKIQWESLAAVEQAVKLDVVSCHHATCDLITLSLPTSLFADACIPHRSMSDLCSASQPITLWVALEPTSYIAWGCPHKAAERRATSAGGRRAAVKTLTTDTCRVLSYPVYDHGTNRGPGRYVHHQHFPGILCLCFIRFPRIRPLCLWSVRTLQFPGISDPRSAPWSPGDEAIVLLAGEASGRIRDDSIIENADHLQMCKGGSKPVLDSGDCQIVSDRQGDILLDITTYITRTNKIIGEKVTFFILQISLASLSPVSVKFVAKSYDFLECVYSPNYPRNCLFDSHTEPLYLMSTLLH